MINQHITSLHKRKPSQHSWLSRDEAEVKKYIDDPWCGFAFSNRLTLDVARGMVDLLAPENQAQVPKDLPVLLVSGEKDPVGANDGVWALGERYKELGIKDVQVILYPQGRHEMLNEINRDEVHQDLVNWLDAHLNQDGTVNEVGIRNFTGFL